MESSDEEEGRGGGEEGAADDDDDDAVADADVATEEKATKPAPEKSNVRRLFASFIRLEQSSL